MARNLPNSEMSAFGTTSRIGHDSTKFYKRAMYDKTPKETKKASKENEIEPAKLNNIFLQSSEDMSILPDNSVHLMVTSPPYNVGKEYDDDLTGEEYREMLNNVWKETQRVLVHGGRACINIANIGRKPYLSLTSMITADMLKLGFLMRGEIIWNKAASSGASCAWGSWCSPSNPVLRDVHEYILVFSKGDFSRGPSKSEDKVATIERDEFMEFTKSIWTFNAESARRVKHPAPYPIDLPERLIKLYTYTNDIVLDPFMGSGTTALAAFNNNRKYVGFEINDEYRKVAEKRLDVLL